MSSSKCFCSLLLILAYFEVSKGAAVGVRTTLVNAPDTIDVITVDSSASLENSRTKREPEPFLGALFNKFGGGGSSSSGASASAQSFSGNDGFGGNYGFGGNNGGSFASANAGSGSGGFNSGSGSSASANSQSFSFGPFSASFSSSNANSNSGSSSGGFFDDDWF